MPGLSASELAIVVFILLLVSAASRLPRWGEALGSYLYKRGNAPHAQEAGGPTSHDAASARTPPGSTEQGPSSQVPPPH